MTPLSVCVFCGSKAGAKPAYAEAAETLGKTLAKEGWQLVYGAGDIGLMGLVARANQAAGGNNFGVIPQHLMDLEAGKRDLNALVVTETMHERKKVMFTNSHAIVLLPGGAGSLDEFFEVLTWAQIGLHERRIFVLNIEGYWDRLLDLIDHVVTEGFAHESVRDLFETVPDVAALTTALRPLAAELEG
ncbi:TIGR00730 family Rossman fold protein [Roseovarius sp. C7]|uniref:LOG family protein n=1 Tax=Roseovarius sp. C7 TaxID=3398643 RepID=UPI0039F71FDF